MLISFFAVVFFSLILGIVSYKFQGKRAIFSIDFIQFVYLFVLAPAIFIWWKSFIFFSLRDDLLQGMSVSQYFVLDTFLSVIYLYLFGVLAIHTITKVLWLAKHKDPLADIFKISEYFHLWWSHVILFVGAFVLITLISFMNLAFPINIDSSVISRLVMLIAGTLFGVLLYLGVWMADPKQQRRSFMKLMHMCYIICFLIHLFVYLWLTPVFHLQYSLFWINFFAMFTTVFGIAFLPRSTKAVQLRTLLLHPGWGNNIDIFHRHHADKK